MKAQWEKCKAVVDDILNNYGETYYTIEPIKEISHREVFSMERWQVREDAKVKGYKVQEDSFRNLYEIVRAVELGFICKAHERHKVGMNIYLTKEDAEITLSDMRVEE